jgi:CRISPR-associated protein Csb2
MDEPSRLTTLQVQTWCRSSNGECVWLSATPVALDRNPGDLGSRDPVKAAQAFAEAERRIAEACERVGLPRPERVWVTRSAPLAGSQKVQRFPRFPSDTKKPQRLLVHATLRFAEPIAGPVLIGAGRYRGLGLFRPVAMDVVADDRARTPAAPIEPSP